MKKPVVITLIVAGAAVVLAGVGAVALGYVSVNFKQPHQASRLLTNVCQDNIAGYNELVGSQMGEEETEQLAKLAKDIDGKDKSETDPTCLFISAQANVYAGDLATASARADSLDKLQSSTGVYASGEINSLVSLRNLKVMSQEHEASEQMDEW